MANFSYSQGDQMYVVPAGATVAVATPTITMLDTVASGSLNFRSNSSEAWFEYMSPNSGEVDVNGVSKGIVKTDLIPVGQKTLVSVINKAELKNKKTKSQLIALEPTVNGGLPIAGQKYMIRVRFFGLGVGGNDIQYTKNSGIVTAYENMTAAQLYTALAEGLNKSFAREPEKWVQITSSATGVTVSALPRAFSLGRKSGEPMNFECSVNVVTYYNSNVVWATVSDNTTANTISIKNGRVTASMEYFFLGERADILREWAWPINFNTVYLADPSKTYDWVNIEYYYAGDAEDSLHSKKQLMIAIEDTATITAEVIANSIADSIGATLKVNGVVTTPTV